MADALNLDPQLDAFVRDQVAQGRYRDPAAVVEAALHLLRQREQEIEASRADLLAKIDMALADGRPPMPADQVFDRLERRYAQETGNRSRAT